MAASSSNMPFPRSPNPSTRSYDSSSVSSAPSPKPHSQYMGGGLMPASSRPNASHAPQPIGVPPILPVNSSAFQPYTPVTASSVMSRDSLPSNESVASTPGISHAQLSANMQAQKRAYRQRRKDPSCDACRERKVKCDATETTSCSECSSRNVKCQFTKETNRRMSSIKQVQDLEKQIERMRKESNNLRRMLNERDGQMEVDQETTDQALLRIPEIGSNPKQRPRAVARHDLSRARANLRDCSKGVFVPPAQFRLPQSSTLFEPSYPQLPAKSVTEALLHSYYGAVHVMLPILHWPTLQRDVDELYHTNDLRRISSSWLSMLFTVMAAGSLFSSDAHPERVYRAIEYMESAKGLRNPWTNDFDLDHTRALFLTSLCLNELNFKSAAWTSLGTAVRVGYDLGLHLETPLRSRVDADMRRRVWWAMYILDRTLSMELGRPSMINDADCDVALPEPLDDHYLQPEGPSHPPNGEPPLTHSLHAIISVVRSFGPLSQTFKAGPISTPRLHTFQVQFAGCQGQFPAACNPSSQQPILPYMLMPVTYLLHARMMLHRHNLMPASSPEMRAVAVEECTRVALDTAQLVARTQATLADAASALLTTHLFRSALFLVLGGCHEYAATCIRALASIDNRRDVATPCGRYLSFFISMVASRRREIEHQLIDNRYSRQEASGAALQNLRRDEELLAYVSADLQASPEAAWIWSGAEHEVQPVAFSARGGLLTRAEDRTGLSSEQAHEWGGWDRLDSALGALGSDLASPAVSYAPQIAPATSKLPPISMDRSSIPRSSVLPRPQLRDDSPQSAPGKGSSARISIANIM